MLPSTNPAHRLNTLAKAIVCATLLPGLAMANTDAEATAESVVVTASQTEHTELNAPASVSVVTRAELDKLKSGGQALNDARSEADGGPGGATASPNAVQ